jgi:hypothetical protein
MNSNFWLRCALPFVALAAVSASPLPYNPPKHTQSPPLFDKLTPAELAVEGQRGTTVERARSARWQLGENRRLTAALARIGPGRKGIVDAFVLSAGLDSDPVFGREAREAARVLSRRYAAATRTIVLAGSDGHTDTSLPTASPANIAAALARIAELMGPEDVLVLYVTAHGGPFGIVYNDGNEGFGVLGPARLSALLSELNIKNRMLLISACYSGVFVGPLVTPSTAILTAASTDRTSFGCKSDNDWTFFGDAVINHALRKPEGFAAAGNEAVAMIAGWETTGNLIPSQPQSYIGDDAKRWLAALEKTLPPITPSVGRPATDALK